MELRLANEERRDAYAAQRRAEFAERCREHGLPVTPQRLAIIEALLDSAEHPSADAIFARVRRRHPHISLATVHRTLETLCEIGEARKVTLLHDSARYDGNVMPHHHVVCIGCRRIRDLEIPALDNLVAGRRELGGFKLLGSSLEIHALCESCAAKETRRRGKHQAASGKTRTS
ncbi:MAG TPA: transcriptional repressor [Candidatus Binataceae bacterium]|nr:transcriptional repressor [Candidatus Binataceae bacterium]